MAPKISFPKAAGQWVGDVLKAPFKWGAKGAGAVGTGTAVVTVGAAKAGGGFLGGFAKSWKKPLIGAGVVAAVGGAYLALRKGRSHATREELNNGVDDLPPLMTTQDVAAQQQQTMMGEQAAPGTFAQRELARRGGVPQQGPVNPAMNVVDPANVQDLGRS